jgi:hypothetical protein
MRIECRALRGRQQHVPLWVAFLSNEQRAQGWIRRPSPKQIELRHLEQHVFVTGYVPTIGHNGRFLIDFEKSGGERLHISSARIAANVKFDRL